MSAFNFKLSAGRKLLPSIPAPSPKADEHSGWFGTYINEGTLNSNLAVLLAAMVCAFICALGLNSLLRCARCYRRRMGTDSSDGVSLRVANTGLKKAVIKELPIVVYSTCASKVPPGLASECSICLAEFGEGEKVRVLPNCNHGFHMECIDKWLGSHSSCPLCRHSLDLLTRNRKPKGAAICEDIESNNETQVVLELTLSTHPIPPHNETLERIPEEAREVRSSLPELLPSSVF